MAALCLAALTVTAGDTLAAAPGEMESMNLRATPAAQGIGGPFQVTVTLEYATDPHATLAVNNLTARLTIPTGLTLVSGANPVEEARIDLPPTQSFLVKTYEWTLRGTAIGNYTLSVNVTTEAAGGGDANTTVVVRQGIVIGQVAGQPGKPKVTDAVHVDVPVTSGFDNTTSPLQVWLYVYYSPSPLTPASSNGSRLRLSTGDTVLGAGFPMVAGENNTYSFTIPAQPRGSLVYWVFAETPHSNVTTRPVKLLVDDPAVSGAVSTGALVIVSLVAVAGAAYLIIDPAMKKPASRGQIHNSPDRVRMGLLVLTAAFIVLALAIALGALNGLWVRLVYA